MVLVNLCDFLERLMMWPFVHMHSFEEHAAGTGANSSVQKNLRVSCDNLVVEINHTCSNEYFVRFMQLDSLDFLESLF